MRSCRLLSPCIFVARSRPEHLLFRFSCYRALFTRKFWVNLKCLFHWLEYPQRPFKYKTDFNKIETKQCRLESDVRVCVWCVWSVCVLCVCCVCVCVCVVCVLCVCVCVCVVCVCCVCVCVVFRERF